MSDEKQIILAPGAGSGIGKQIADDLLARPGFVKALADTLERGLSAKRSHWVSTAKGEGYWEEEEDTRSQLQAAFGILAHMEGEPVKRIIHQHLGGAGVVDPLAALQDSEVLRDAARRLLSKADGRARRAAPAEQPAVEV